MLEVRGLRREENCLRFKVKAEGEAKKPCLAT